MPEVKLDLLKLIEMATEDRYEWWKLLCAYD